MNTSASEATLAGQSIIGNADRSKQHGRKGRTFNCIDPSTGDPLEPAYRAASDGEVAEAGQIAAEAFPIYSSLSGAERARFLHRIAERLEERGHALAARGSRETGLPQGRLEGELTRTMNQLRMFATLIEDDEWRDPRIDRGEPEREPAPKPDVRSMRRAIGPVAVFGASNFPLAFSVPGGDTASALAAGCPVIVKAHPSHPGTSELTGDVIAAAARELDLPEGVFSLLFDDGHQVGQRLVQLPEVKAVGFTGSRGGGEALMRLALERPEPIPVYAEMGSVNPFIVLPKAARERAQAIAEGVHRSFTLGVGQFCTSPGVVLVPADEGEALVQELARLTRASISGTMLNAGICANYGRGLDALRAAGGRPLARGQETESASPGIAALWEVDAEDALREPELFAEVFGPSTLLVRFGSEDELLRVAHAMEGQLTATLHAQPEELPRCHELIDVLAGRAGRVIVNEYPTGVEVGPAMVHGGPFPATSDGRSTSVGTHAIERFTRYVAYQNVPQELLPAALRDR